MFYPGSTNLIGWAVGVTTLLFKITRSLHSVFVRTRTLYTYSTLPDSPNYSLSVVDLCFVTNPLKMSHPSFGSSSGRNTRNAQSRDGEVSVRASANEDYS